MDDHDKLIPGKKLGGKISCDIRRKQQILVNFQRNVGGKMEFGKLNEICELLGKKCKFTFGAVHKLESHVEEPGKPTQKIPTKNSVKGGSASRKFKKVLRVGEHTL